MEAGASTGEFSACVHTHTLLSLYLPPLSPSPLTLPSHPPPITCTHLYFSYLPSPPSILTLTPSSLHTLLPSHTGDEVREMLDGLCGVVKAEVDSELINSAHTHAILLRQLFQTADRWHLNLEPKISELENRCVWVCGCVGVWVGGWICVCVCTGSSLW